MAARTRRPPPRRRAPAQQPSSQARRSSGLRITSRHERIRRIVGVVESGLFISRADPVFVADAAGVRRLDSARAHRGSPPILVIMGVSGSGKSTIAEELSARLGWPFEE